MSSNVFDRFDETEEQGAQQASGNVFDQFDGEVSGTRPAEGNVFDRFEAGASQQEAANEATGPLETSRQSVIRPMGSGDINVFGDASGFTQEAIEGWGPVAKSQAFRQGDWQTRQRMRGDYLDSTLRSRLSGPEYSQALEEFMNATGDDVFRPDRLLRSQSLNAGYGGGLADQRALQERRQAQADNSGMGLQLPGQSQPGVDPGEANSPPERAQVEGESQESGSILTDFGNLLSMGADRAALNTREVVRKTFGEGVVASIDRADEWLNGKESEALLSERIERNESELTTETTEARGKAWWDSEKGALGPAWSDWRSYFSGITESLPETAMTMAPSMMLSKGVYAWNTARGVAPKLAAKRAATTATLAGGLSEGLLGGAASSREVRDSIRNMPEEQLRESVAIQSLMSGGGLTFEQARDTLAEDASSQAFITSGVITGAFGGMGDRALAGIITGGPTSRLGAALRGAAGEGIFEEMPQEAGQQASENLAMRRADESIGVLDDVPNAALGGLAIGASMGAGMGAAAGGRREPSNQEEQPQEAGQTGERRENSSDAEFERVWREHERENNLEPIDLQQDTGTVIDIAPNADLIRMPRHELSSAEREARDSLTYGNDFKTLRAAAEQKGDADAVAELDAVSEQVSDLLGVEALSRTRGESLVPVRERLNAVADRFTQVVERIRGPQADTDSPTGLDRPGAGGVREAVEQAAATTDINPTSAQAEAGNYRKGRVRLNGFDIAIENPKGSTRRGTALDGTEWQSQMAHHYGDIKGTTAADGDNLDVFVGDNPTSSRGYIIDQVTEDGSFDEHKVMLGFDSLEEARQGYLANYEADWQGLGSINEMSVDELKTWIREGATDKPYGEIQAQAQAVPAGSSRARSATAVSEITPGAQVVHNGQPHTVADVITHPTAGRRLVSFRDAPNNYVFEDDVSAAIAPTEVQQESEIVAKASPESKAQPATTLKADGKPFQTRRAVELSKRFRDTPNATPIEVEGGWGFTAQADTATSPTAARSQPASSRSEQNGVEELTQEAQPGENPSARETQAQQNETSASEQAKPSATKRRTPTKQPTLTPRQQRVSDAFGGAVAGDTINLLTDVGYSKAGNAYTVDSINKDGTLQATNVERGSSVLISQGDWTLASRQTKAPIAEVTNRGAGSGEALFAVADDTAESSDTTTPPNDAPHVRDLAQRLTEHPALSGVRAIQSVTELPVHVLDTMEARGIDASKVAGVYDPTSGESFVVADNLMDTEEGVRRAVHEAVGHQGIHGVLGADVEKVMLQVYQSYRRSTSGNDALREIRHAYPYLNPETDVGKVGIAEELVARSIERSDNRPALRKRVMAALRNGLRTLFPGVAWTDADIQALGERSRRYMQSQQARQWQNSDDPASALGLRSVVRASGGEAGVSVSEAQRTVDAFMARYQGNIPLSVRVAATQEELYGPQATAANVGRLKGGYHPAKGVMTVVAGNARGVRDIQRTLRHEILGHYGLNTFTAEEKRILLDRILETQDAPSLAPVWETVRRNYADSPLDVQAEEVFAHVAEVERNALGQAWDRVLTGLQRAVRVTGLSRGPLRLAEIHDLARRIGEGIREGRRNQQVFPATDQDQFSREAPVDDPSIRFSLKDKQPDSVAGPYGPNDSTGFALPDESRWDAKVRVWADKMRPLERLRKAIRDSGSKVEEEADPYLVEELYHGRLENDLETFRREHVEPLAEGLAKAKISQADLDNYVYALHAPERNAVVAERNPNDPSLQDGGSGMSNAEAAEIIEKAARSGKQAAYDRLAKIVHGITAVRRDAIRDGGLETDDVMDAWESTYQHYVPLKGFANDEPEAPRIGKGFQITGKESFMVKGRRERAASPSTQAIVDANLAMIRRRKNEVGNAFLSMVTDHPNPSLWEVFTDDTPDTERSTVRVTDPDTGKKRWEVRERPVQMGRDDRYFKTKRAGLTYYIKVKDQRLLNAMRNVGPESNFWITRVAGAATRMMSAMMTSYNPEFLVTNFARDVQTALLNIGAEQTRDDGRVKGQKILQNTARDMRPAMQAAWRGLNRSKASQKPDAREWDRWFREFIEDGAKTGYFDAKDVEAQAKEIAAMVKRADGTTMSHMLKARKKAADFVENLNSAVENAVRLSAYVNARRVGVSRRQSASLAKNLTVNFNRRGEISTGMNAAFMFYNASTQGIKNFARVMITLKDTPNGKNSLNVWSRMNLGQKIGFGMASAAFALASLNRWLSDEDDDGVLFWDKVPNHVKERNYVLMTGWLTGNPEDYVKIPLPYGYNTFAVAGTHFEKMLAGSQSPVEAATHLGLAVVGSFSPIGFEDSNSEDGLLAKNLTPTLARSLVQLGWNEDFAARMIYRENDSYGIPSPESALYMRSTPEAYKTISKVLNDITNGTQNISGGVDISPDVIQHLVNYYGGGAWSFAEKTIDLAARSASGQEVENYRIPFVGKVLGTVTPYQDQSLFYQRRNELGQIFKEAESLEGREGVDYRRDNRERIRLYLDAVDITSNLRDLRDERDVIEVSSDLDDATKRERIEEVEERMKFQVDRFNRQYNALE